jgi:hypothetical protein
MQFADKYPDLESVVKGSTYKKFFDWMHIAAQLRYTTKDHLNRLNKQFGTKKKLDSLRESGFLTAIRNGDVYVITEKSRKALEIEGYNTSILQKDFNGLSVNHEVKTTDAILNIINKDQFYAVFYYDFGYVRPDAIVILRQPDAYKIVFLEVEEEKKSWQTYLDDKKQKYCRLAEDKDIYDKWWQVWSNKLKLPYPTIEQFCFWIVACTNTEGEWKGWGLFEGGYGNTKLKTNVLENC